MPADLIPRNLGGSLKRAVRLQLTHTPFNLIWRWIYTMTGDSQTTLLPLHETINRWLDTEYIPQQPHDMLKVLSRMACCNLTALASIAESFPVGDDLVYSG